ncbi:MAG: cytochrome bc1 complex diheme cytochrome c subunit [Actinomycetota bacterium]
MTNQAPQRAGRRMGHSRLRRRLSGTLALGVALLGLGGLYTVFAPQPQTARAQENLAQQTPTHPMQVDPALVRQGEQLYDNACITCHGTNLQGVRDRGPSLIGAGEAAVYFQVSTGRMPSVRQEAQEPAKPPRFTPEQIDARGAFVQANGGGPVVPARSSLIGGDPAQGGDLFRLNCASCHNFTGRGIALSSGQFAPEIRNVDPQQIYSAMISGPQSMPRFSNGQLTVAQKRDIIAYVESFAKTPNNPGGYSLGGFGPVPEGAVAWLIGISALVGVTLWIGSRA